MKWRPLIIFLFFSIPVFSQTKGKIENISLYEKDLLIMGEGRKGPYLLPDSLIIENTAQVFLNGAPVKPEKYTINYIDGEIRFLESVPSDTKIRIVYKKSPYPVQKEYFHHQVVRRVFGAPTSSENAAARPQSSDATQDDYASQLQKSGSLTRGVTVGNNRGLKVNSALNLNVSGKVSENVEVIAALTDQTTPIQPEGTTQNLQEIDKVFVKINAPNLSATMGDYELDLAESQFARYSRKLQGAMGQANYDDLQVTVSGAVSRGKYRSLQFMGQEGNQGPYQLSGDRGQIDIIVLAGTERVYIDGEQMVRGESNDYVIDYAAAQITFTRTRLITADSRIVVDFQYSDERFRRNLYTAQAKGQLWSDRIKLGATLLHEADDKNNPLDFTLSDENLKILQNAGDDPANSVTSGASYVGAGNGRYFFEDGIYKYVGADSGDYQVSFSDVGDFAGDYSYKGQGIYEYVGQNLGRYNPVILLPTAKSHNILDFDMEISPVQAISLKGEIALSNYDENSYSSLDDENNQGVAQNWTMTLQDSVDMLGAKLGYMSLSGKIRTINDQFTDIDRTNEIEYNRRWDLPSGTSRGESAKEFNGLYEPVRGLTFGGEYGQITKGDYFSSNRWQATSSLQRQKLPKYNYRIERIEKDSKLDNTTGDWWRQRGNTSYQVWKFQPFANYEGEVKKENWSDSLSTGFRFNDYKMGMETKGSSHVVATASVAHRKDDDYLGHNLFEEKSTALTQNYKLRLNEVRSFSASMEFTHRERKYADQNIGNKKTDLAEAKMQFTPWKRAVSADLNYQISNTATAQKERIYIKVSEGDGNYRFDEDLNEYVNDPLGDYILRIITTDQFLPVVELKTSSRLRLQPNRIWGRFGSTQNNLPVWKKWLTAISSESYVAIDEKTQEKDVWSIYMLDLSKFRQTNTAIFGNMQFRQDLHLFENSRDFSVRLRHYSRDEKNNQYLEGGQDRIENENSAQITARISSKLSSQSELTSKRTSRLFFESNRQDRDIYADEIKVDLSYRPKSPLEIALESRFSLEEDRFYDEPTQVKAYALAPRVNYSLRSKGRLRGELEWSYVESNPKDRIIPYEMASGRSLGNSIRWDVRFDYRISQTIQATFSYTGRNEPERERTIHTGRAQITAAFR